MEMLKSKRKVPALQPAFRSTTQGSSRAAQLREKNTLVCAFLRLDFYLKVQQLVFAFRKVYACSFLEVELRDVCKLRSRLENKLHI